MNTCPNCHSPVVSHATFCTACGSHLDSGTTPIVTNSGPAPITGPRFERLGAILLIIGVVIYGSSAVSHLLGQVSSCLGDGSNDGCGNAAPKNQHVLSAALFIVAAVVAFFGNHWSARSTRASTNHSPASRQKFVFGAIAILVVAGIVTVKIESRSAPRHSNVGAMATILQRTNIPGLHGDLESLDSGGQQFYGTAPVRRGDISTMCRSFLDALSRIESQNMMQEVTTEPDQVTSCVNQLSVVVDAPIDGVAYPTGSFHVAGRYRTSSSGGAIDFWAVLSLDGGRGANPTTPYPAGYQWSVSISEQ